MLIRSRIGVGNIIEGGPRQVNVSYVQIQKFVYILFLFIVLGNSFSHLIEMCMLIN